MGVQDGRNNRRSRLEEGAVNNEFGLDRLSVRCLLAVQVEELTKQWIYKFATGGNKCS